MAIMTGPFHAFTDCNNIGDDESPFDETSLPKFDNNHENMLDYEH